MIWTKQRPDFFKIGIRALALFQVYLAYLLLIGAGFGFDTLDLSLRSIGALILVFLSYLMEISTGEVAWQFRAKVALGLVVVGLFPLLINLPDLIMGIWGQKDWVFLGYFLIGSGGFLEMYWK